MFLNAEITENEANVYQGPNEHESHHIDILQVTVANCTQHKWVWFTPN